MDRYCNTPLIHRSCTVQSYGSSGERGARSSATGGSNYKVSEGLNLNQSHPTPRQPKTVLNNHI